MRVAVDTAARSIDGERESEKAVDTAKTECTHVYAHMYVVYMHTYMHICTHVYGLYACAHM